MQTISKIANNHTYRDNKGKEKNGCKRNPKNMESICLSCLEDMLFL